MSGNRRCSFCGHDDTVRLFAGPRGVFICSGCVERCAENFSGGSHWDAAARTWVEHAPLSPWPHQRQSHFGDDVTCSFCGKAEPDLQWLVGCRWPNTFVCDECVGLYLTIGLDPSTGPTPEDTVPVRPVSRRFRWPWQPSQLNKAIRL
ncbi:MAG TPA: ClpX C4-type zinc finger protein [Candidatus Limnocylindria bacterium]|nr:ClpX C4-type zinc finger protein [Candidatus Limnocylindria bacterium]